jgi:hypothetical protein
MNVLLSVCILLTYITETSSLWRGNTLYYKKDMKNKLSINDVSYSFNITKNYMNEKNPNYLNLRLKSNGIFSNIPKRIYENESHITDINFYDDIYRSIISFNYSKLELTTLKTSAMRYGGLIKYNPRFKIININNFIDIIMKFNYCKSSIINPFYPNTHDIQYSTMFYFKNYFLNENRINYILVDNLIISIPPFFDNKNPYILIIGCFLNPTLYKQLNIYYNVDGILYSLEINEYKLL